MKTSSPTCPMCQGQVFELRVKRDEAVAAVRCVKCAANYLLLDSKDYWFDVIQKGYPRLSRCSCKNQSFQLQIDYNIRDDGDVDYIELHTICPACGKTRRQLEFEVDYGGTDHLIKQPLVPCKNPKVLYDLKDISLLLELPDIARIVDHLASAKCEFLTEVWRGDHRVLVRQDVAEAKETLDKENYVFIYAMPRRVEVPRDRVDTVEREQAFWKRSEVIRIGPISHVCVHRLPDYAPSIVYCSHPQTHTSYTEIGLWLDIDYSNEFVRGERIISKSKAFQEVTASLLAMLAKEFVSWRGPLCFDNPKVNTRVHGDHYRTKADGKRKR